MKKILCIAFIVSFLMVGGCKNGHQEEKEGREVESIVEDLTKKEAEDPDVANPKEESAQSRQEEKADTEEDSGESPATEVDFQQNVGIRAHVKEYDGEEMLLISSDSEGFPGVFCVKITSDTAIAEGQKFLGGEELWIQMADTGQKNEDGIPIYQAQRTMPPEEIGWHDVLLTAPPMLYLTDALSSTKSLFEVHPGNFEWNYREGDMTVSPVACGAHPLDSAFVQNMPRLSIPAYNRLDKVPYTLSFANAPNILMIRRWAVGEAGNIDAKEDTVSTYYYPLFLTELEPGYIYEFVGEWEEDKEEIRNFSGIAHYVFLTESKN